MSDSQTHSTRALPVRPPGPALVYTLLALLALIVLLTIFALRSARAQYEATLENHFTAYSRIRTTKVRDRLAPSLPVLKECMRLAELDLMQLDDADRLGKQLGEMLRNRPNLRWLSFSSHSDGRFVGARRDAEGEIVINRSSPDKDGGKPSEYLLRTDGRVQALKTDLPGGYDPRTRRWYQLAVQADGPVWDKPAPFNEGVLGITAATAVRQKGKVRGVFTADMVLSDIAGFLEEDAGTHPGMLMVLDRAGEVIAAPRKENPIAPRVFREARGKLTQGPDRLPPGEQEYVTVEVDQQVYLCAFEAFSIPGGLEWVTAVMIDRDEFGAPIGSPYRKATVILLVLVALGLGVTTLLVMRRVAQRRTEEKEASAPRPPSTSNPISIDVPMSSTGNVSAPAVHEAAKAANDPAAGEPTRDAEPLIDLKGEPSSWVRNRTDGKTSSTSTLAALPKDVVIHDLTGETLLKNAPRLTVEGRTLPTLGGIPLLHKIGSGGMAEVYYAFHPRLGKGVAVKVLARMSSASQTEQVQRLFREAQMASRVESDHLVRVFDVNQEGNLYFMVMEYINGGSAGDHLRTYRHTRDVIGLPEDVALDICVAATRGLAAAHNQGIVHRDIKPDNIMLPRDGHGRPIFTQAKLADLGIGRTETTDGTLTGTDVAMGTVGYMAPEQAREAKSAGKPADVFAMGSTLYDLLAGRPPFVGSTPMAVVLETLDGAHDSIFEQRPEVSMAAASLIDKCLMKNPRDRYEDGQALLVALQACREEISKNDAPKT